MLCEFFQLFSVTFTSIYHLRTEMCLETIVSMNPTLPLRNLTGIRGEAGALYRSDREIMCPGVPLCVDISVQGLSCNILPSYWSSRAGPIAWCLAQLTGPVTGATLIKREITTFLASPSPTVVYLPCSLNMELQPTLKIS